MSSLLDKFEDIEVLNSHRMDEADKRFCDLQFEFYEKVYKNYKEHLDNIILLQQEQECLKQKSSQYKTYPPTYIWEYSGISSNVTKKELSKLSNQFVSSTCNYFDNKYNINSDEKILLVDKNYAEPSFIELDDVLEKCVFATLDGLSFFEKAVEEIKQKAKNKRYYSNWDKGWNYDIKDKTIKFRFSLNEIRPALYFYDSLETELKNCFSYNRVEDFTSYNNGNTNIKFLKSEYAMEFARKYLGHIE